MKVVFLDFDGVLNSEQEVIMHWRKRKGESTILRKLMYSLYTYTRIIKLFSLNFRLYYLCNHCDFCPIACSNVQYILDESPDTYIVISSTWRTWGMKYLKKILKRNGIDPKRVIGRTGAWEDGGSERGDQITGWLKRHEEVTQHEYCEKTINGKGKWYGVDERPLEPVTAFAVLDDDSDMSSVKDNFVQTDNQLGCTIHDARKALAILKVQYKGKAAFSIIDEMGKK